MPTYFVDPETIASYKSYMREVIQSAINAAQGFIAFTREQASAYATLTKTQIQSLITWSYASIQAGLQYGQQLFASIFNRQNLAYILNFITQTFQTGYHYAIQFFQSIPALLKSGFDFCVSSLIRGYHFGHWLFTNIGHTIIESVKFIWDNASWLITNLFRFTRWLIAELATVLFRATRWLATTAIQILSNVLQLMWDLTVLLAKNLHHFITHLPTYFLKFCEFIKDFTISLFSHFASLAKFTWRLLSNIISPLIDMTIEASKFIFKKTLSALLMSAAVVYAFSELFVDFVGDGLNYLLNSVTGMSLANLAAFAYLKTSLSIGLALFITYQVARYSLIALSGLIAVIQLKGKPQNSQPEPERQQQPRTQPTPTARFGQEVTQTAPTATPSYRRHLAAANETNTPEQELAHRFSHFGNHL